LRINYPCLVAIRSSHKKGEEGKNDTILTHTDNVGIGGVCVVLNRSVEMFSTVALELDLLDMGSHICCSGKVVWNIQKKETTEGTAPFFYVGIKFIDINNEDQKRLEKVIERLIEKNT
jgi:Tfp pilus assembly protein PilZ